MDTIPTSWELASLVCKLMFYFGAATLVGGSLCLWRYSDGRRQTTQINLLYIALGAFLGFQGVLANYLIQVGLINDSGLSGMFDWDMASLLLDTPLGDTTFFRLAGFVVAFVTALMFLHKVSQLERPPPLVFYRLLITINLFAFLLLLMSFRFSGHISVLSTVAKLAIAFHFFAFAAWIGALYPLYRLTSSPDLDSLQGIMGRFGDNAIGVLLLLIIAGVLMSLELFASPVELISTAYGLAFLLKLTLVVAIVGIAAANKLRLTPTIRQQGSGVALRNSIRLEMVVALLILLVTSYLSTIVGPADH